MSIPNLEREIVRYNILDEMIEHFDNAHLCEVKLYMNKNTKKALLSKPVDSNLVPSNRKTKSFQKLDRILIFLELTKMQNAYIP